MPTYRQLNQRHPSSDCHAIKRKRALYAGNGPEFKECLPSLLPQRTAEPNQRYELRKAEAHYLNYLGPIIDFFTSMLFSTRCAVEVSGPDGPSVNPPEFYGEFFADCDQAGTKLDELFKAQLTSAMVDGFSWVRVHAPEPMVVESRADFEQFGLGECWIEPVESMNVLDWEDAGKGLEWAVVHSKTQARMGLAADRDTITETWEFLTPDFVETYAVNYKKGEPPSDEQEIPRKSVAPHGFGSVPLVCLDLPIGLHVAARLETPQVAHFRLSNAQSWSLSQTCYAMPVFKLRDRKSPPTMGAGYGLVIGAEESMEWAAPPGAHFAALANEIKAHKDEIFRVAQQMALGVENNAAAVGRSAESKAQDAQSTRVVLLAYARIVKETIIRVYDMIARERGEDLTFEVQGLDDFAAADIGALLEAMKAIEDGGGIPSAEFHSQLKYRAAEGLLPDLPLESKLKIRAEIRDGVEKQFEEESELAEMTKELKKQPPGQVGATTQEEPEEEPDE